MKHKTLPTFSDLNVDCIESDMDAMLSAAREKINALVSQESFSWETLVKPMESIDNEIENFWAVVSHLNSVTSHDALRAAYNNSLQTLTAYSTEISHNKKLYEAVKKIPTEHLDAAQKKWISDMLRDFHLNGVDLNPEKKKKFAALQTELATLQSDFSDHVLDATDAWSKRVEDEALLSGLPDAVKATARDAAKKKGWDGWLLTLDYPCYLGVMKHADDPSLREDVYKAFVTLASDQLSSDPQFDNSQLMVDIVNKRQEVAALLDFDSYAEYSLATKMAKNTEEVFGFLKELGERSIDKAREEFKALQAFSNRPSLEAWDVAYYSEKMKHNLFDVSQEALRPYFPFEKVMEGLFSIVKKTFSIDIRKEKEFDTWHDDVHLYSFYDADNQLRGYCYMDLFARQKKRSGAWVADGHCRLRDLTGQVQLPVAFLCANFHAPTDSHPSLLTHDDAVTLFHEFGHALHHVLTLVDHSALSGTNGVEWDAVEFPSQLMENWCWQWDALQLMSGHYKTGETMPKALFDKLSASRTFQAGMQMVRQLEFSVFDFKLHSKKHVESPTDIQALIDDVRSQLTVVPVPSFHRFQNSFTHIFAGGYAAGYYGYKWAEVMSCDGFSVFKKQNLFDQTVGASFRKNILEKGGSAPAMALFKLFTGHAPRVDALLESYDIEV